jgi:hypothetical protein
MTELTDDDRRRIFWWYCMPLRASIAFVVTLAGLYPPVLPFVAVYTVVTSLEYAYYTAVWLAGIERIGGNGGVVWWNKVRVVHLGMFVATTWLLLHSVRWAGVVLVADTVLATGMGLWRYPQLA